MTLDPALDLMLTRDLAAPRALLYRCWTTAEHLMPWFVPAPHRVTACRLDPRVGGCFDTTFEVDGQIIENRGVFLDLIPNEKIVFTDTYSEGWKPTPEPFMTAILTFADVPGGGTRYTALVRHRTAEAARQHDDMGFQGGWGTVAAQLDAYAQALA